jgi:fructose-1-phosphate kinase PfkB-like protein
VKGYPNNPLMRFMDPTAYVFNDEQQKRAQFVFELFDAQAIMINSLLPPGSEQTVALRLLIEARSATLRGIIDSPDATLSEAVEESEPIIMNKIRARALAVATSVVAAIAEDEVTP